MKFIVLFLGSYPLLFILNKNVARVVSATVTEAEATRFDTEQEARNIAGYFGFHAENITIKQVAL